MTEETQTIAALTTAVAVITENLKHRDANLNALFEEVRGIRKDIQQFATVQDSHIHGLASLENRMTRTESGQAETAKIVNEIEKQLANLTTTIAERQAAADTYAISNRYLIQFTIAAIGLVVAWLGYTARVSH